MRTQTGNPNVHKNQSVARQTEQRKNIAMRGLAFSDNRAEAVAQRKLQQVTDSGRQAKKLHLVQNMADRSPSQNLTKSTVAQLASGKRRQLDAATGETAQLAVSHSATYAPSMTAIGLINTLDG